eukprot:6490333-Pyramimonas_sp.AAC.1
MIAGRTEFSMECYPLIYRVFGGESTSPVVEWLNKGYRVRGVEPYSFPAVDPTRLALIRRAASLDKLGLEATDKNAEAMMRFLGTSPEGYISYGSFRNFLMLLPREHEYDSSEASAAWYEAATFVPIAPVKQGSGGQLQKPIPLCLTPH